MKFIQQVFLNVSQVVKHEIKLAKKIVHVILFQIFC